MEMLRIQGGNRLSGTVLPSGNKNEALPALAAALLTNQPVTLHNVPRIRDVLVMCDVMVHQGAEVTWLGPNSVCIHAAKINGSTLNADLCRRVRASILFAGPVLARTGRVVLPPPGGDVIGRRRLDTHFHVFQALGAQVEFDGASYDIQARAGLKGRDIFLDEASVTATENAIMAASLAPGTTVLRNAASEPHVCGLARMLLSMGAKIHGLGTNVLVVEGVESLHGCEHEIDSDYLEIGSFIGLAAVTRSALTIERVRHDNMRMIRMVFERLGISTELENGRLFVPGDQSLEIRPDYHNQTPRIDDAPWPAFPTDLMSIAITVATQCKGTVLFFEKMFEGRMFFVDHLQNMGAQIILCDPHRVVVVGPTELSGGRVQSPDVRAGMALLIAALCAKGETRMYNIGQIDRGYERVDEKMRALGARVERVPVSD